MSTTTISTTMAGEDRHPALVMLEEFSHRAFNDYSSAIAALDIAARRIEDSDGRGALLELAGALKQRADTFRLLRAPWGQGPLNLGDYLQTICSAISSASLAHRGISLTLFRQDVSMRAGECWCIGLAVSELINNAARHGLIWGADAIHVAIGQDEHGIFCSVTDNGRPCVDPGLARGRRIISALIASIGGQADWEFARCGARAVLRIPHRA